MVFFVIKVGHGFSKLGCFLIPMALLTDCCGCLGDWQGILAMITTAKVNLKRFHCMFTRMKIDLKLHPYGYWIFCLSDIRYLYERTNEPKRWFVFF